MRFRRFRADAQKKLLSMLYRLNKDCLKVVIRIHHGHQSIYYKVSESKVDLPYGQQDRELLERLAGKPAALIDSMVEVSGGFPIKCTEFRRIVQQISDFPEEKSLEGTLKFDLTFETKEGINFPIKAVDVQNDKVIVDIAHDSVTLSLEDYNRAADSVLRYFPTLQRIPTVIYTEHVMVKLHDDNHRPSNLCKLCGYKETMVQKGLFRWSRKIQRADYGRVTRFREQAAKHLKTLLERGTVSDKELFKAVTEFVTKGSPYTAYVLRKRIKTAYSRGVLSPSLYDKVRQSFAPWFDHLGFSEVQ